MGRQDVDDIVAWVGDDPARFARLMEIVMAGSPQPSSRAAWVASYCVEALPGLLVPHFRSLLDRLERVKLPVGVMRNLFKILESATIPGDCEGRVMSLAMAALGGPVPVAVKVYAMTVLKRLTAGCPELVEELRRLIEEQWHDASPGFRARARMEFGVTGSSGC